MAKVQCCKTVEVWICVSCCDLKYGELIPVDVGFKEEEISTP